eukprot:1950279-Amphidinium_carterae.1
MPGAPQGLKQAFAHSEQSDCRDPGTAAGPGAAPRPQTVDCFICTLWLCVPRNRSHEAFNALQREPLMPLSNTDYEVMPTIPAAAAEPVVISKTIGTVIPLDRSAHHQSKVGQPRCYYSCPPFAWLVD